MNKILVFFVLVFLMACGISDEKRIVAKWQSDDVWYEYLDNNTYNSGRGYLTMIKGFKYSIDIEKKELTMYTDDPNQTYYLQYQYKGNDTLLLNNVLNSTAHFEAFSRIKK
ncbi:MAG: hypothetical protein IPJ31_11075 [Bacteroidetes bacterium]|nr:hypothetical protein [Bacteroidota bacterium]